MRTFTAIAGICLLIIGAFLLIVGWTQQRHYLNSPNELWFAIIVALVGAIVALAGIITLIYAAFGTRSRFWK